MISAADSVAVIGPHCHHSLLTVGIGAVGQVYSLKLWSGNWMSFLPSTPA